MKKITFLFLLFTVLCSCEYDGAVDVNMDCKEWRKLSEHSPRRLFQEFTCEETSKDETVCCNFKYVKDTDSCLEAYCYTR